MTRTAASGALSPSAHTQPGGRRTEPTLTVFGATAVTFTVVLYASERRRAGIRAGVRVRLRAVAAPIAVRLLAEYGSR